MSYSEALDAVGSALRGPMRRDILDRLSGDTPGQLLAQLRAAMRRHVFPAGPRTLDLRRIVSSLDTRSRREGLHVLQGWDFTAHRFTTDIVPVLQLDYCGRLPRRRMDDRAAAAVFLDQYFLSVASLLAVRAWDHGDANANLDRVSELLDALQGPDGSGHPIVDDAETLLFLAISYYHPDEAFYDMLLRAVESLDAKHQLRVATASAAMLGAHLRWGLRFMYRHDVGAMRADNVADYPWLLHAVLTLARHYGRLRAAAAPPEERLPVVEALLAGLSPDPWAFSGAGAAASAFAGREQQVAEVRTLLTAHRMALLDDLDAAQPAGGHYVPLGFTCNFPTNAAVAMVAVTLEDDVPYPSLSALLVREWPGAPSDPSARQLATRLLEYSTSDPSRLGAGGAPLVAYDPYDGAHAYNTVVQALRDEVGVRGA